MTDKATDVTVTQALKPCPMGCIGERLGGSTEFEPVYCRVCGLRAVDREAWNTRTAHSGEGRDFQSEDGNWPLSWTPDVCDLEILSLGKHEVGRVAPKGGKNNRPRWIFNLGGSYAFWRTEKTIEQARAALLIATKQWLSDAALSAPQGEVERLARNVRGWLKWHGLATADDDNEYLNGKGWDDAEALASTSMGLLAALAQPEAGGEHE